jgi:hypothetical protein
VNDKFGILSVYMFVTLPKAMDTKREKQVTLASIPAHESECEKFMAEFRQANPAIAERVHGEWVYKEYCHF